MWGNVMKKAIICLLVFTATGVIFLGSAESTDLLTEGFEGTFPPTGWTIIDTHSGPNANWDQNYLYVRTGNYSASVYGADKDDPFYSLPQDELMSTDGIDLSAYSDATITFWYQAWNWEGDTLKYNTTTTLEVSTDTAKAVWTPIWTFPSSGVTHCEWHEQAVDLDDYTGQTVWLAWNHYYNGDGSGTYGDSFFIDDVVVSADTGDDDDDSTDDDDNTTDDDTIDDDSDDDNNDDNDDNYNPPEVYDQDCCGNECPSGSRCGCCL